MLVGRSRGTAYTFSEISSWMEKAGLVVIQRFPLAKNSHAIVGGKGGEKVR